MKIESENECSICLEPFIDPEKGQLLLPSGEHVNVRILPNCAHMFHSACINKWLSKKDTCPLCRTVIPSHTAQFITKFVSFVAGTLIFMFSAARISEG